jgi:hypothetical protein
VLDFANVVKAQVTQTLLTSICERAGYRVTRLGVEELVTEVKYLSGAEYQRLALPNPLRTLPDLLIAEPQLGAAFMVEVKFRTRLTRTSAASLNADLSRQREFWSQSYAVVMLGEARHPDCTFHQDFIRVIGPEHLALLTRQDQWVYNNWEQLPHLQHVFTRMKGSPDLQGSADMIVGTLRQLASIQSASAGAS